MSSSPKVRFPYRWVNPQSEYPDNRDIFVILKVYSEEHYTQILSAGTEGAYLMYPDEHHFISVPLLEATIMDCNEIAQCLLANEEFLADLVQNLLNDPTFLGGIGAYNSQLQLVDGNQQVSDNEQVKDLKSTTNDKDVVWGGCREVVELWIDYIKTLCFFLQTMDNITDLVTQLYDADKKKRYKFEGQDQDNNGVTIGDDGEIVNNGGEWEFVPNILGQLVGTIAESSMVGFLTSIAGIGAGLILADITDTRAEAISCILFNQITCDGETPLPPPYVFDNPTIFESGNAMLGDIDAGLVGNAIGLCLTVAGTIESFVSLFPMGETHRNFRIGMRSPSDEWMEICDACSGDACESLTIDPVIFGITPSGMTVTTEFPIPSTPSIHIWQPNQVQQFSFGANNFGQAIIEYQPEQVCNRNLKLTYQRRNTQTCIGYIDTFTTSEGWVQRATNTISLNTSTGFIQTLTWNNTGGVVYEKFRFRISSPFPNFNKLEIL